MCCVPEPCRYRLSGSVALGTTTEVIGRLPLP
jgi:hypothetical protein